MGRNRLHTTLDVSSSFVTRKNADLKTMQEIPAIQHTERIPAVTSNDTVSWIQLVLKHSGATLAFEDCGVWYIVLGIGNSLDPDYVDVVCKDFAGNYVRKAILWHTKFHLFLGEKRK